jgi:Fic family protein
MQIWKPIEDLPENWQDLAHDELAALAQVWQEQRDKLEKMAAYQVFLERMRRKIAIETGIIERLYTIDRGITQLLIERGIDEALIPHGATDQPVPQVIAFIRDHETAIQRVFDFVGNLRPLSTSYIKQLHQLLTRNQTTTDALDQFGNIGKLELLRGDWKKFPNNPKRNGDIYEYCPPEQVASQMDQLVIWHLEHDKQKVNPDVEAAWLHHRFTQIHPFQDGNGRVARLLASLVFIRANWFPLVITNDERDAYIHALEKADNGNLKGLIDLFAKAQKQAFISGLSLSEEILTEGATVRTAISSIVETLQKTQIQQIAEHQQRVETFADQLFAIALERLEILRDDIQTAVQGLLKNVVVFIRSADSQAERNYYYKSEIVETAKTLEYFANLYGYKSWLRLAIRIPDELNTETNILLSFHRVGVESRGVMGCVAFGIRKTARNEEDPSSKQEIEPLSQELFTFTYLEDNTKLETRYRQWLENVLVIGLEYWRKGL